MSARSAVVVQAVKKAFPLSGDRDLEVLDVEYLALAPGSCTVLQGRSGSGKTTLLNLIAGIIAPSAGRIHVDDTDLFALPQASRDRFRAKGVGYVFQTFNLFSALSAIENVVLAMMFAGTVPRSLQRGRAADLLGRLGLSERLGHKPPQLSRGEQQRVAIARALANSPSLVLADEPCASLDARTASEVLELFLAVCRQDQRTVLLVSHDVPGFGGVARVIDMGELNRTEARRDHA
jgi:putative ABC transport system ATP-binding protein